MVLVTQTQVDTLLLEPVQELDCGTSLLLDLEPKPELWKNIVENTGSGSLGSLGEKINLSSKS